MAYSYTAQLKLSLIPLEESLWGRKVATVHCPQYSAWRLQFSRVFLEWVEEQNTTLMPPERLIDRIRAISHRHYPGSIVFALPFWFIMRHFGDSQILRCRYATWSMAQLRGLDSCGRPLRNRLLGRKACLVISFMECSQPGFDVLWRAAKKVQN